MKTQSLRDLLNGSSSDGAHPQGAQTRYAVAYLRVSKDDGDEQAQRPVIEKWTQENGVIVKRWFSDHAERANDVENRVGFRQAVEFAKLDPEVSLFVVRDEARFFRNSDQARFFKVDLVGHGVHFINVFMPYDPRTREGRLKQMFSEWQAEDESMVARERVLSVMPYRFSQRDPEYGVCYVNGGYTPFGYKAIQVERGTDRKGRAIRRRLWLPDDTIQAGRPRWEWVRVMLLDWFTQQGWGDDRMAKELNTLGVTPVRNTHWSKSTLYYLRSDTALLTYCGYYLWGKRDEKWLGQKREKSEKRDKPLATIEGHHEPLLSLDEAERVRAERVRRGRGSPYTAHCSPAGSVYALSGGVLRCGKCKANWTGVSMHGRRYYVCGSWAYRGGVGCGRQWDLPQNLLDDAVFDQIAQHLTPDRATVGEWAGRLNAMLRGNGADHDARRVHLRTRLKELDTEARNVAEAIRRGVLVDALTEQAQAIERERAEVERRLKELDALTMPTAQVTTDDVLRCWETLTETLRHGTAVDRKAVARAFVKELWAHPDTHVVEGRLYDPRLKVWGVLVAPRGNVNPPLTSDVVHKLLKFVRQRTWEVVAA